MLHFVWWILVGLIAGWAAGKIMKGSGYGTLGDIILGIVGAVIGGWIMRLLGFTGQGGTIYTILIAIVGAVILVWVVPKNQRKLAAGAGPAWGLYGTRSQIQVLIACFAFAH